MAAPYGRYFEDLTIGDAAESERLVSEAHVMAFAEVSGDYNPVHVDAAYAAESVFKERIAHGMLGGSFISALLGNELPGPGSIYLSQTLRFHRPVKLGVVVKTRVEVVALNADKAHVTLACASSVNGKTVIDGEAIVLAPRRGR